MGPRVFAGMLREGGGAALSDLRARSTGRREPVTGRPRPHSPTLPRPPGQGWNPPASCAMCLPCFLRGVSWDQGAQPPTSPTVGAHVRWDRAGSQTRVPPSVLLRVWQFAVLTGPWRAPAWARFTVRLHAGAEDEAGLSGQTAREGSPAGWHGPVRGTWA